MVSAAALVFHVSVLLASLAIIAFSGNYFVEALESYARKLGMSKYFIGMVVVAVATSSPDIVTAVIGLLSGRPEILSGVVLGGLMIDLAFMNGLFSVLQKRITINTQVIKGIEFVILGLMVLPYVLMLDGEISRSEGMAMVLSYLIYVMLVWNRESGIGKLKKQIAIKFIWQDMLVFLLALGAMLLAARYAVFSAINLSAALSIPLYLLAITIFAFAAALPDMLSGLFAILRGHGGEIGFGEAIGTTMLEVNLFTGAVAIVTPMHYGILPTIVGVLGLMLSATYFMAILRKGVITREQGCVFIAIYAAYIIIEVTRILWWGR